MTEEEFDKSADPIVHYQFGHECQRSGDFEKAIKHFRYAISLDPEHLDAEVYAFTAWLLAMCPDASLRDSKQAVEFATVACKLTDWSEGWTMGILAAALAEDGDISAAIKCQEQACDHAFDLDTNMQHANLELLRTGRSIPFNCYP